MIRAENQQVVRFIPLNQTRYLTLRERGERATAAVMARAPHACMLGFKLEWCKKFTFTPSPIPEISDQEFLVKFPCHPLCI